MSETKDTLVDEVMELMFIFSRAMQRLSIPDWLKLDLSMAQMKVLFTLALDGPIIISKVAETLGVGQPTASHLVDRLVQTGLVERAEDPTDRRYTLARLSQQGEEIVGRLRRGRESQLHSWLTQLNEKEVAALWQGLQALVRVVQSASPEDMKII